MTEDPAPYNNIVRLRGDKPLPHDIPSEDELLGALLFDPGALALIDEYRITPDMFWLTANKLIYQAIQTLNLESKSIDMMSVVIWLNDRKFLDKVGGQSRIRELVELTVSAVRVDACAESIRDKYFRRRVIQSAQNAQSIAQDFSKPLEAVLEETENALFLLGDEAKRDSLSEPESCGSLVDRFWYRMDADEEKALLTGFYDLDAITGGLRRKHLVIGAGRASMGKSHFGLAMAYQVAKLHKQPVLFLTLEMPSDEVMDRLFALHAKIDSYKIGIKDLSPKELETLAYTSSELAALPIEVDESVNPSIAEIRSKVRRTMAKYGTRLGLIVVDYVQLMRTGSTNRVQELDEILCGLRAIAKEFDTTVLGLAQISRSVEGRSDKRPTMGDIRESGSFEMTADRIILLYREDYYDKQSTDTGTIELIVAKNRGGRTDTCKMLFQPQFSQFLNIAR